MLRTCCALRTGPGAPLCCEKRKIEMVQKLTASIKLKIESCEILPAPSKIYQFRAFYSFIQPLTPANSSNFNVYRHIFPRGVRLSFASVEEKINILGAIR